MAKSAKDSKGASAKVADVASAIDTERRRLEAQHARYRQRLEPLRADQQ